MKIELNENHYNEIIKALEFYIRFHTWQSSMVFESWDYKTKKELEKIINEKLEIQPWDYRVKWLAYEISRMMLFEQNKAKGIKNVHSYEPLHCTWEDFIKISY